MKIAELFEQKYSAEDLAKIAKDPQKAYRYATDVLNGPFPAGEAAIATNAQSSYNYACYALKGPFLAGEAEIAKHGIYSCRYADDVLEVPWPAGEAAIATNAQYSFRYARSVLEGPFKAGEAIIAKSAMWSYEYVKKVLQGPFPAGEAVIVTNGYKDGYVDFLKTISVNIDTLLLDLIQQRLDDGEEIYLDFMEGRLEQKGLIEKIDKNIVYANTNLGIWFVQDDADEHFTLRKVAGKLVVQKV